jgi:hypothetical protein
MRSNVRSKMILAFGESIVGFALLGIIVASLAVIGRYVYVRSRSGKRSVRLRVATGVAGLILMTLVVSAIREGAIEYNPVIKSSDELIGDYAGGDYSLTLKADGTFVASGFSGGSTGNWSNFDWNLSLSGLGLSEPRVITRNGRLCIAPFYAGPDADHGVLLKKQ